MLKKQLDQRGKILTANMPDTKKAVALGYQKTQEAIPKVIAKGYGHLAQEIINKAQLFDINIFSNEALVDALIKLELNDDIPIELYQSVAELFAWLTKIETAS